MSTENNTIATGNQKKNFSKADSRERVERVGDRDSEIREENRVHERDATESDPIYVLSQSTYVPEEEKDPAYFYYWCVAEAGQTRKLERLGYEYATKSNGLVSAHTEEPDGDKIIRTCSINKREQKMVLMRVLKEKRAQREEQRKLARLSRNTAIAQGQTPDMVNNGIFVPKGATNVVSGVRGDINY